VVNCSLALSTTCSRPIDDGGIGAIALDLFGDVGLGPVLASLAPHDLLIAYATAKNTEPK
jgi:hypothetical protein